MSKSITAAKNYEELTFELNKMFKNFMKVVKKDKIQGNDLAELTAKIESLQETTSLHLKEFDCIRKYFDMGLENQILPSPKLNLLESRLQDRLADNLNRQIQENQNETDNRLREMQESNGNKLKKLENQYRATQTANATYLAQISERQAEIEEQGINIERKYNEVKEALHTFERNQKLDRRQLKELKLTILELEKTLIKHEDKYKQLEKDSHSLATYFEKKIATVELESRALINVNVAAVRDESKVVMQELLNQIRNNGKLLNKFET